MEITVYIDVLFITNFLSDFFLLHLTEKIARTEAHILRRIAAALLSSLYACLTFLQTLSFSQSIALRLLTALAMLCIAFRFCSPKQFARCTVIFLCGALLCGGACYALFFATPLGIQTGAIFKGGIFYWHIPVYVLLAAYAIVYALLYAFERLLSLYAHRHRLLYPLDIRLCGQAYSCTALLDTGNTLYDANTNLPVIILEADALPPSPIQRYITCRTIAGEAQTLPLIEPEAIYINGEKTDAILALTQTHLNSEKQFRALLHPACIQGGHYEHTAIPANEK